MDLLVGDSRVSQHATMLRVASGDSITLGKGLGGRRVALDAPSALARSQNWVLVDEADLSGNIYIGMTADFRVK